MSQVLGEELPAARIGVISGPHLALEVVRRAITATVIASADPEVRAPVQSLLRLGGQSLNSAKPSRRSSDTPPRNRRWKWMSRFVPPKATKC